MAATQAARPAGQDERGGAGGEGRGNVQSQFGYQPKLAQASPGREEAFDTGRLMPLMVPVKDDTQSDWFRDPSQTSC